MTSLASRLEILSPSLIEQFPATVKKVDKICHRLGIEIGWHYILDITWILQQLDCPSGVTILDAGAGTGALQFVLAERGYNIISVDFFPRFILPTARMMFPTGKYGVGEFEHSYIGHLQAVRREIGKKGILSRVLVLSKRLNAQQLLLPVIWARRILGLRKPGKVSFYQADMRQMDAIADKSIDAVVSVSAIEHMEPEEVAVAVSEFERVLKPGGKIVVTTSAAKEKDWFHEPSKGWCFSQATLKEFFRLGGNVESNWALYDSVMDDMKACKELQRRMPYFYRLSGNNGMPYGKWDPQYLPVGVLKAVSG